MTYTVEGKGLDTQEGQESGVGRNRRVSIEFGTTDPSAYGLNNRAQLRELIVRVNDALTRTEPGKNERNIVRRNTYHATDKDFQAALDEALTAGKPLKLGYSIPRVDLGADPLPEPVHDASSYVRAVIERERGDLIRSHERARVDADRQATVLAGWSHTLPGPVGASIAAMVNRNPDRTR